MKEASKLKAADAIMKQAKQMSKHEKLKMAAKLNAKKQQLKQKMAAAAPAPQPPADKPIEIENVVKDLQNKPTPKVPEKAPTPEPK